MQRSHRPVGLFATWNQIDIKTIKTCLINEIGTETISDISAIIKIIIEIGTETMIDISATI